MHAERYRVGAQTAKALRDAKQAGRPVVAVGTTTLRSLEDLYRKAHGDTDTMIARADAWATTELFLRPKTEADRYRPWVIDGLVTNFHQPCSTLFMLVSMLIGIREAKELYARAVASDYRLYSYGDASLLWL
jgi:S-adenosylmethionine:tRNA ribosyltransferase-isomerase